MMVSWHEVPGKSEKMNPSRRVRFEGVAHDEQTGKAVPEDTVVC